VTFSWIMIPASKGPGSVKFYEFTNKEQILACADYPYLLRTRFLMSQYLMCSGFDNSSSPFPLVPMEVTKLPSVSKTWILGLRAPSTIYIISCLLSTSKCSNKGVNCPGPFPSDPHCFTLFYKCSIFKKFLNPWIL